MNKILILLVCLVIGSTLNTIVKNSAKAKQGIENHLLGK